VPRAESQMLPPSCPLAADDPSPSLNSPTPSGRPGARSSALLRGARCLEAVAGSQPDEARCGLPVRRIVPGSADSDAPGSRPRQRSPPEQASTCHGSRLLRRSRTTSKSSTCTGTRACCGFSRCLWMKWTRAGSSSITTSAPSASSCGSTRNRLREVAGQGRTPGGLDPPPGSKVRQPSAASFNPDPAHCPNVAGHAAARIAGPDVPGSVCFQSARHVTELGRRQVVLLGQPAPSCRVTKSRKVG